MEETKKEKIILDDLHKIVLKMFLTDNKSIREISDLLGLGRTKISNMLEVCAASDEEIDKKITLRKLNLRTHKNVDDIYSVGYVGGNEWITGMIRYPELMINIIR